MSGAIGDVRFYAAQQLVTPDEVVIGTLCVSDVTRDLRNPPTAVSLSLRMIGESVEGGHAQDARLSG